ncbi:reverse transcriptase domain-containing protein, partial [Tanacetum coccineum]
IAEDILVDVAGYVCPVDFVILDIKEDEKRHFILGTPFLTTAKVVIKFDKRTITLRSGKSDAPNKHPNLKTNGKPVDKENQVFLDELESLKRQEKDANDAAEALRKEFAQQTDIVNTTSTPVSTASTDSDLPNPDQDDSEILIRGIVHLYSNPNTDPDRMPLTKAKG